MSDHHDAEFIEYVVKQLVENPDGVAVERTVDEMGVLIQLTVDRNDMGRVIGKEGRTAKALRTLLRVLGAKNNARVNLKIMEPDGGEVRIGTDDDAGETASAHEVPAAGVYAEETPAAVAPHDQSNDEEDTNITEVL